MTTSPSSGAGQPFDDVLDAELAAVNARRQALWKTNAAAPGDGRPKATARGRALDEALVGLAFSGGGIRSGTFALGFLQGLARLRLLRLFDYLSTVSGGGYAGAWLAAWLRREGQRQPGLPAVENVEQQLDTSRVSQHGAARYVSVDKKETPFAPAEPVDDEPEPVYHLRAYSNYLTPRPGVFSSDFWTVVTIYVRNTLINLLILVPALLAVVMLSRLVVWGFAQGGEVAGETTAWSGVLTVGFFACGLLALLMIGMSRARARKAARSGQAATATSELSLRGFRLGVILPAVLAAVLGAWAFSIDPVSLREAMNAEGDAVKGPVDEAAAMEQAPLRQFWYTRLNRSLNEFGLENSGTKFALLFGGASVGLALVAAGIHCWYFWGDEAERRNWWLPLGTVLFFALVNGLACYLVLELALWKWPDAAAVATLGPPLFLLAFVLAGALETAAFSRALSEYEREWRSRLGGALVMAALSWVMFFVTTLYLPGWVARLGERLSWAAVGGWALTTLGGVLAGRSPQTGAGPRRSLPLELVARVAPPLFLIGLLALAAVLATWVLAHVSPLIACGATDGTPHGMRQPCHGWPLLVCAAGGLVIALLLSRLANINVFSLHALYANRLTRCYLGASRVKGHFSDDAQRQGRVRPAGQWGPGAGGAPTGANGAVRRESPVTGFDPQDDFPLAELSTAQDYLGPYPLFNTAVNLVAGDELAVQDRKAESFVLTPDYCGCEATGYAKTPATGGGTDGLTLGRAMAISGAAVDPNMSFHQSPPVTALLTVFNARLGWWMQSPREAGFAAAAPPFGLLSGLGRELFGLTHARGQYVHLSDGGHFDNSGIYELVRRRCRFIVAVDAGADRQDCSENLAQLMRLVRTDFGVRIEIDTTPIRKGADGLSRWHVAVGRVRYDDVDPDALAGTLVFVRASLTGDEPADVKNYAATNPAFPHHATFPDQFFDEPQFESYRALGEHVALSALADAQASCGFAVDGLTDHDAHRREVRRFFAAVRNLWYPPPPAFDEHYDKASERCVELMARLRGDEHLDGLAMSLYPETAAQPGAELLAVNEMLGVMELAWLGVRLGDYHAHPMNRGWMNAFRRWSTAEAFQSAWPILRGEYSKDFVRFCERALNLPAVRAVPVRLNQGEQQQAQPLYEEFEREWGAELAQARGLGPTAAGGVRPCEYPVSPTLLRGVIEQAFADSEPMVWLLKLGRLRSDGEIERIDELRDYPVGVLAVYRLGDSPPAYEVMFWLRGAYRSLGIGRHAIEYRVDGVMLYEAIRAELRQRHPGHNVTVIARYPGQGPRGGDRLQRSLWLDFLHDYDFRRVEAPDDPFLILSYTVTAAATPAAAPPPPSAASPAPPADATA